MGATLRPDLPDSRGPEPAGIDEALWRFIDAQEAAHAAGHAAGRWWGELRQMADEAEGAEALDELLKGALGALRDALDADSVSILLANDEGDELVVRASAGAADRVDTGLAISAGEGIAGRVMLADGPVRFDEHDAMDAGSATLGHLGMRSVVAAPLRGSRRVLGVLHADSLLARHFSEFDERFVALVAERLSLAIERVELHERERSAREHAARSSVMLSRLHRITSLLSGAHHLGDVIEAIVDRSAADISEGVSTRSLWLVEGAQIRLRWVDVMGRRQRRRYAAVPLDAPLPAAEAVRTGEPLWFASSAELTGRFPALTGDVTYSEGLAVLPLTSRGGVLGVLSLGYAKQREFGGLERDFLLAVAAQCGQAVERVRVLGHERRARQRFELLADVTKLLNSSVDPQVVVERVADLVVGEIADVTLVTVPTPEGLRRQIVKAVRSVDPALVDAIAGSDPIPYDADAPAAVAWRTVAPCQGRLAAEIRDAPESEFARLVAALDPLALSVPMTASSAPIGVMSFLRMGPTAQFSEDDVALAAELAARTGVALENTRRYQSEHEMAVVLQRAVLPDALPAVAGLGLSARYRPGTTGTFVGGDWYDAIALPDGCVFFSVGDVMGKGPSAAALMGQVRTAMRVHALGGASPAAVLAGLDRLFLHLGESRLVTAVAGIVDPGTGELTLASAGHPPPVILRSDGTHSLVEEGRSMLLGAGVGFVARVEHQVKLGPGDRVLVYSDGLVERRGESIDQGVERVVDAALVAHPTVSVAELVDLLLEHADGPDDVVVLGIEHQPASPRGGASSPPISEKRLARRGGAMPSWVPARHAGRRAVLRLPAHVRSAPAARHWLEREFTELGPQLLATACLLLSETVTNAILHSGGALEVAVEWGGGVLRVEVADESPGLPTVRHYGAEASTGRGLLLVEVLARAWGVSPRSKGKVVWFEVGAGPLRPEEAAPGAGPAGRHGIDTTAPPPSAATGVDAKGGTGSVEVVLLAVPVAELSAAYESFEGLLREFRFLVERDPAQLLTVPGRTLALVEELGARFVGFPVAAADIWEATRTPGSTALDLRYQMDPEVGVLCERYDLLLDEADEFCRAGELLTVAATPEAVAVRKWLLWEFVRQVHGLAPTPWPDSGWARRVGRAGGSGGATAGDLARH